MYHHVKNGGELGMKSKTIGVTTPLFFEDKLLIVFSKEWIGKFDGIPQFVISIDKKKRLCLTSIKEVKDVVE